MDKMAQWKSSILGINKSSHGGPVKGKMPMSAPMAKYANGGRVVKMQDGGSMKEMARKYALKAIEGVKNASASVKSAASRATTRPKDMSGTIDKVEAAIRSASGRAITVPKSAKAAVLRAVTPPKSTMGDYGPEEQDTDYLINRIKAYEKQRGGDYGRDEPEMDISDIVVSSEKRDSSLPKPKAKAKATAKKKDAPMSDAELIARAEKRSGEKMFAGYKPSMPDPTKKSHGGKVMAKGGAADMKQDKAMLARHNRLMHPGQKSKLMNGGMVNKYAGGGAVKKDPYASDKTQGLGMMTDKEAKIASMKRAKDYPSKSKSDYAKQFKSDYANRRKDMLIVTPDNEDYMSGRISGRERQDKAKRDNALNAYANRGKDYIKDKLDDVDVAISKKIGLKERARTKESFREGLKEEGYNTGGKVMKKGGGGAMRVQGDMKRPQFSASKSFDGGKTRIGMSAGKGNFRASFSKKFADGGAVTRLANEASGVISDMTKNRTMMKKGGSVKKGSMMKAKGSMMKAMSNKR